MLIKNKENCLSINGMQSVGVEKGTTEFQNYFKQIPVPFKIYADFECKVLTVKNTMIMFLVVLLTKLFVLMIELVSQLLFMEVKMLLMNLLRQYLKEHKYCIKVMKITFLTKI